MHPLFIHPTHQQVIYSDGDLNLVSSGSAAKVVKADKTVGDAVLHVVSEYQHAALLPMLRPSSRRMCGLVEHALTVPRPPPFCSPPQIDSVLLPVPEEDLAEAEIAAAFAAAKTATAAAIVGRGDKKRGEGADAAGTVAADSLDAASMEGPASNEGGLLDQVSPGAVAAAIAAASAASEGSVEASNIDAATLEDALVAANLTAMLADVEVRWARLQCRPSVAVHARHALLLALGVSRPAARPRLSSPAQALGLLDTLRNGDFTIFAPSADVYEAVTSAGLDTAALKQLLVRRALLAARGGRWPP